MRRTAIMRTASLAALVLLLAACDNKATTGAPPAPPGGGGGTASTAPAAPSAAPAGETTYFFGVRESHTNITFQSKNDLTDILGASHNVVGSAKINFEAGTGSCELSVPAATLNSGMADRDRSMMSPTWLNVKQFPNIEFKGEKASIVEKPNLWKIDGKFTLRGVTKDLSITAKVRPLSAAVSQKLGFGDGPCLKVETGFKVKLADYGIEIPATAIATVQPEISIGIDIWGSTIKPAALVVKLPAEEAPIKRTPKPKVSDQGIEGTIYVLGKKPQLATMTADSEAELEKITAKTSVVVGYVGIDKAKGTGKVRLAVPAEELDTGIALRNEHLRGPDWLDTAKFKTIEFESTKATRKDDKNWTLEGDFTLHGVKKAITVDVLIREIPLELIQKAKWGETPGLGFATKFKIKLSDFGVKIPAGGAGKVSDELSIAIDLVGLQKE
ncbi:MAG: YceI family protein [Planctomycetes bacterium]|nr:YceI family protein [Planctomycetota bacterium]